MFYRPAGRGTSFDPVFLRMVGGARQCAACSSWLVLFNLVVSFQAFGTFAGDRVRCCCRAADGGMLDASAGKVMMALAAGDRGWFPSYCRAVAVVSSQSAVGTGDRHGRRRAVWCVSLLVGRNRQSDPIKSQGGTTDETELSRAGPAGRSATVLLQARGLPHRLTRSRWSRPSAVIADMVSKHRWRSGRSGYDRWAGMGDTEEYETDRGRRAENQPVGADPVHERPSTTSLSPGWKT